MKPVTFFETPDELAELTGLSKLDLLYSGVRLDDMSFGFESTTEWNFEVCWSKNIPYYEFWLLNIMDSTRYSYKHVALRGKHYYILYWR